MADLVKKQTLNKSEEFEKQTTLKTVGIKNTKFVESFYYKGGDCKLKKN